MPEQVNEIEIDVLVAILKRKKLIIFGSLIITLIAIAYAYIYPTYTDEIYIFLRKPYYDENIKETIYTKFNDKEIIDEFDYNKPLYDKMYDKEKKKSDLKNWIYTDDYKKYSYEFNNKEKLLEFVSENFSNDNDLIDYLKKNTKIPETQVWTNPRGSYETNFLLNLKVKTKSNSPVFNQKIIKVYWDFIWKTVFNIELKEFLMENYYDNLKKINVLKSLIIKLEFTLQNLKNKGAINIINNNNFLQLENNNSNVNTIFYLKIVELNKKLELAKREKEKIKSILEFFDKIKVIDEPSMDEILKIKDTMFPKESDTDILKEINFELSEKLLGFQQFLEQNQFLWTPSSSKLAVSYVAIVAFSLSLFFLVFLAILIEIIKQKKDIIFAKYD